MHVSTPQWDLPLVLEALASEPFEPLELSSLSKSIVVENSFASCLNVSQKGVRVNRSVGAPELLTDLG